MIGQKLLHYQILEKLGEGGMGVVYKARDTHLGRFVAVKVLSKSQLASAEQRQRFLNEAKAASALNHPNIIHIYGVGSDAGVDFIAMEYVSGKTLMELLRKKPFPASKALNYAIEIADALAKAHAAGIVHRDLKPSNVMVSDEGVVKLLDFGLAKLIEPAASLDEALTIPPGDSATPTREGVILGTVAYMAPEQAEGKAIDGRSDIFSLGAVLYEMVSGQRAFPGDSPASTLVAVMTKDPPSTSEAPKPFDRVILRCLRKNRAERWQSMVDLKIALEDLYHDHSTPGMEAPPAPERSRTLVMAALAAVALVAAAVIILAALRVTRGGDEADLSPRPLTSLAGTERHPTLSPDGSQVAFAWDGERQDNFDIYVRHIHSSTLLRLTDDLAEEDHPAWSPDGRWIAFHRHLAMRQVALYLISPLGGRARRIGQDDLHGGLSWTPDGKWLVLPVRLDAQGQRGIFLHSIETGERRRVTTAPMETPGDADAVVSPDGRAMVFVRLIANESSELYVLRLDEDFRPRGEPVRMPIPGYWRCHSPEWSSDSREIIFSGGTSGGHALWRLPADGSRPPRRLAFAGESGVGELTLTRPPLSATTRLVYSRRVEESNVWRLGLRGGLADAPTPIAASTRPDAHAQYSPDGSRIAFESARSGNVNVWVCDAAGGNPVALTATDANCGAPAWSPDGLRVAYESNSEGNWNIYTIDATGENPRRMTLGHATYAAPVWSGDGKWIYFASREHEIYQVWKMPAAGGDAVQVTNDGGYMAIESRDGKFLFFTKDAGYRTGLWKRSLETGQESKLVSPVVRNSFFPVDDGVYFIGDPHLGTLNFLDFRTGGTHVIRTLDRPPAGGLSLSPDGGHILFSQFDRSESDLMLVDNFR
ncbi:MAG: serine/threonine-protein kinase [Bryobacteraceae bacterium]|nr:serine/threonine-protein kinase [Bryobacteraceae bacterium]